MLSVFQWDDAAPQIMTYDPNKQHRKSIRLQGYDYSQSGAYFVTICTYDRECLFGEIVDGEMILNEYGKIVQTTWMDLPNHISNIELDAFVVMPNHIHGIIVIPVGAGSKPAPKNLIPSSDLTSFRAGSKPAPTMGARLSEMVRQLKTFSARKINQLRKTGGHPVWQRNYYEHVIRDDDSWPRIREYIVNNPKQWNVDHDNIVPSDWMT